MVLLAELMVDFLVSVVFDCFLTWTGDLVLFVLTLGRLKPVFPPWKTDRHSRPAGFRNGRALLGLLFWTLVWIWFRN